MDLRTAIILLALQLLTQGGLVVLVSRHNARHRGMLDFGVGLVLFGIAYMARLWLGLGAGSLWGVLPDAMMVTSVLLFLRAQQRLMQAPRHGPAPAACGPPGLPYALGAAFGGVQAALLLGPGAAARLASLNAVLALGYLVIAASAWRGSRQVSVAERPAQRALLVVCGVLGLATAPRAVDALVRGVETLFQGPWAQAYYALSSICALLLGPMVLWWMFSRLNAELSALATQDTLTGALNRNGMAQALARHFAPRRPPTLTWLMLDLDHFKHVNDTLGHAAGDRLLEAVGARLLAHVRGGDFVARLGGEEFGIGAAGLLPPQAQALAERLRAEVAALRLDLPGGRVAQVTASVGVSPPFARAEDAEAAMRAADAALYAAKAEGRNRVVLAPGAPVDAPAATAARAPAL